MQILCLSHLFGYFWTSAQVHIRICLMCNFVYQDSTTFFDIWHLFPFFTRKGIVFCPAVIMGIFELFDRRQLTTGRSPKFVSVRG